MFFFLSKTLDILLTPIFWVFFLLVIYTVFRRRKHSIRLVFASLLILFLISNFVVVNSLVNAWEIQPKPYPTETYDIGIVLTGVTDGNRDPKDRTYFTKGAERITTPLELYKKGILKKILITGGVNTFYKNSKPSALVLKSFLICQGVPETDILTEEKALNTRENALLTKTFLEKNNLMSKKTILFTSAFHMRRSEACFKKVGIICDFYPVSYYGTSNTLTIGKFIIPDAQQMHHCTKIIREIFGYLVYKTLGYA